MLLSACMHESNVIHCLCKYNVHVYAGIINTLDHLNLADFMPQCMMHCRCTVVHSCVGLWVLHIYVSGKLRVLKVGQHAKSDILARKKLVKF